MLGGAGFLPSTVPPPPPFFFRSCAFSPRNLLIFPKIRFKKQPPNHRRNTHGKIPTKKN